MRSVPDWEAIALLDRLEAIREGHFVGTSGRHLSAYVQKEVPTRHPRSLRVLAEGVAWLMDGYGVETIVAPPMGALGLGIMVAEELDAQYVYLEEEDEESEEGEDKKFKVKRAVFKDAVRDHRVGIVEDIFTTGQTSRQSIAAVRAAGGEVVVLSGIYNRGEVTASDLGVPFEPLVTRELPDWSEDECAEEGLCSQGVAIVLDVGHGRKFQQEHPDFDIEYVTLLS